MKNILILIFAFVLYQKKDIFTKKDWIEIESDLIIEYHFYKTK